MHYYFQGCTPFHSGLDFTEGPFVVVLLEPSDNEVQRHLPVDHISISYASFLTNRTALLSCLSEPSRETSSLLHSHTTAAFYGEVPFWRRNPLVYLIHEKLCFSFCLGYTSIFVFG